METKQIGQALGIASVVALSGLCLYVPFRMEQGSPEDYLGWRGTEPRSEAVSTREMTADERVATLLPALAAEDPAVRADAMDGVRAALNGPEKLAAKTREDAAHAFIDLYDSADEKTPQGLKTKKTALASLITEIRGETAARFAEAVFLTDSPAMQLAALEALASPRALRDKAAYAKALEAVNKEGAPAHLKPAIYRKAMGKAAGLEILALLHSDARPRTLTHGVVELQNLGQPELMGPALERLDSAGMLEDGKQLPWFNGKLLAQHIQTADGKDLIRALRVVWLRPSLTRATMPSMRERLAHSDPDIRRMVARIIPDAVSQQGLEASAGEELLTARMAVETDPAVKGALEGSLSKVRETRRSQETESQAADEQP